MPNISEEARKEEESMLEYIGIHMPPDDERKLIEAARTFRHLVDKYNIRDIQIYGITTVKPKENDHKERCEVRRKVNGRGSHFD